MIQFSAFEALHQRYKEEDRCFLSQACQQAHTEKPYQGLRILHNIPLTLETVLKIEVLLLGGAEVTASCITALPPSEEALALLRAAQVDVQIEHRFSGDYDFHLDCCGELIGIAPPKRGAVELTQTGSALYKKASLSYPVLSIDDSELKLLETLFGTGDGFIRALQASTHTVLYDKKYVIFGYGKVGRGVVRTLLRFTDNISVIDSAESARQSALKRGIKYIDAREREKIKKEIQSAAFVVTATGVQHMMSDFYGFKKADFGDAVLTNMGAYDEYGKNFSAQDILFEKKPLNFAIPEPTTMHYLDPIFYAHNYAIDLLLAGTFAPGYHPFPSEIARDILKKWEALHHEELSAIEDYFI